MASEDATLSVKPGSSLAFSSSGTYLYIEKTYNESFRNRLITLREKESYTDILVSTKTKRFPCHKVLLAAASPFFDAMFNSGLKETSPGKVEFNEIPPNIMEAVIDYFYTGRMEITTENVQALIEGTGKFELDHLKEACDIFSSERVEPPNCMGLLMFAKEHGLKKTLKASQMCLLTRLKDVHRLSLDSEYQTLSEEALTEIISQDDLEVEDETIVYEFAMKWITVDASSRNELADNIIQYIRLPLCSAEFLSDVVQKNPLIKSGNSLEHLLEALNYHMLPGRTHSGKEKNMLPRKYSTVTVVPEKTSADLYEEPAEFNFMYQQVNTPMPNCPRYYPYMGTLQDP